MTDITTTIDTPAAVAAVTTTVTADTQAVATTVENTATTVVADAKTDATKAEQSIIDFRAAVTTKLAQLETLIELDHQRVDDFIASAKAREEAFIASVEAKFASIETGTKTFVQKIKSLFGAK